MFAEFGLVVNWGLALHDHQETTPSSPRSQVPYYGNQTLEGPGVEENSGLGVPIGAAIEAWDQWGMLEQPSN